ncbi:hypothetical protein WN51_03871 [Melipona quadrifasciata]|uniref:Uncharacterized protein n=1 Tax=Melipona quadrifasciata TaxID=166423 RepID=A0A0M9ADB1_9HYME|nr:hypothetical protein WN51_03871 [Melipona quadrifasciata]
MYSGMETSTPGRRDGTGTFVVVEKEDLLGEEKKEEEDETKALEKARRNLHSIVRNSALDSPIPTPLAVTSTHVSRLTFLRMRYPAALLQKLVPSGRRRRANLVERKEEGRGTGRKNG